MVKGVRKVLILFLLLVFSAPFVLGLGEWSQFQKDGQMSAYQSLTGFLTNYTYMTSGTNAGNPTLQPLVSDFNGFRKLLIVKNSTFYIYDSDFILEKSLTLNNDIYAITTSDFDLDGNTEIILIKKELENTSQADNISMSVNFRVYQYFASTLTLENNFNISLPLFSANIGGTAGYLWSDINPKISNIICGQFIGANDCVFISPLNITQKSIYAFNSTATSENDNLLSNLNLSAYAEPLHDTDPYYGNSLWLYTSGKIFWTLDDLNGDGFNEINFVWSNAFLTYPSTHNFGNAIFFSIDRNSNFIRNVSLSVNDYTFNDSQGILGLAYEGIDNTITKLYNFNGVNKYIIVALNRRIATGQSSFSFFGIYDNNGYSVSDDNLGYDYGYRLDDPFDIIGFCPSNLDFIPYGDKIYVFSNMYADTVGTGRACGKREGEQELSLYYYPFTSPIYKSNYFNLSLSFFEGNIKGADFTQDVKIGGNPVLEIITKSGVAHITAPYIFNFDVIPFTNTSWSIPADINKDYYTEFIYINGTDYTILNGTPAPNYPPQITTLFYNPNNPVCVGSNVSYAVNYSDLENDSILMRVDCYGNLSYIESGLSKNPLLSCNYSELGNYNAEICIRDLLTYGGYTECRSHYVSTQYTNCANTWGGWSNSSYGAGGTGESNAFGFFTSQFAPTTHHYTSMYFDYSKCDNYTILYGVCPLILWTKASLSAWYEGMFAYFWIFLLLILAFLIFAIIRKHTKGG